MVSSEERPVVAERTSGGVLLREKGGEAQAYVWAERAVDLDERA